jgi:hypothetical protein
VSREVGEPHAAAVGTQQGEGRRTLADQRRDPRRRDEPIELGLLPGRGRAGDQGRHDDGQEGGCPRLTPA